MYTDPSEFAYIMENNTEINQSNITETLNSVVENTVVSFLNGIMYIFDPLIPSCYYQPQEQEQNNEEPPLPTSTPPPPISNDTDDEDAHSFELDESFTCSICMEESKQIVFQCGHLTCEKCAVPMSECPFCRREIQTKTRMYMS
jgi:hypothetical protein